MNKNITYIISYSFEGGTKKFLLDLEKFFPQTKFIKVLSKENLNIINLSTEANVLVNNLYNTDIGVQDLIELKNSNYKLRFYIVLHDMFWINYNNSKNYQSELTDYYSNFTNTNYAVHGIYLKSNISICPTITNLFNLCDNIICPSKFVHNIYSKYYLGTNLIIVPHIDLLPDTFYHIPEITNNTINIGNLNNFCYHKGSELIEYLKNNFTIYKGYNINWIIVGSNISHYDENEFFEIVTKYNIHCLTYLSIIGETWCYSLTKGIVSGLPLFYNNIGSFNERIDKSIETNFIAYESEQSILVDSDKKILSDRFEKFLDLIIQQQKSNEIIKYNFNFNIDDFYLNNFTSC